MVQPVSYGQFCSGLLVFKRLLVACVNAARVVVVDALQDAAQTQASHQASAGDYGIIGHLTDLKHLFLRYSGTDAGYSGCFFTFCPSRVPKLSSENRSQ
jgi:hypothetical protein